MQGREQLISRTKSSHSASAARVSLLLTRSREPLSQRRGGSYCLFMREKEKKGMKGGANELTVSAQDYARETRDA